MFCAAPVGGPRRGVPSTSVETRWRPETGQVVLVEIVGIEPPVCLTGVVEGEAPGPIVVDLGASAPQMPAGECEVTASFFNPEALYLGRGHAARLDHFDRLIELDLHSMQAVQRRRAHRIRGAYPVALGGFAGDDYVSVAGETIDVAPGGCRVVVSEPLPAGITPTVCIQLFDHETVIAQARVLEDGESGGSWEYRLAFDDIDEPDRRRLAELVG